MNFDIENLCRKCLLEASSRLLFNFSKQPKTAKPDKKLYCGLDIV